MMRFTLTDDDRVIVHAPLGERSPSAGEAEKIRQALEAPPLPAWLEYGSIVVGILALLIVGRGGGS